MYIRQTIKPICCYSTRRCFSLKRIFERKTTSSVHYWRCFLGSSALLAFAIWSPKLEPMQLGSLRYSNAVLTGTIDIPGSNTRLIELTLPKGEFCNASGQAIWSIYFKDDDMQIERPFTPLAGIDSTGRLQFWIKRYTGGEMSQWLFNRQVGSKIEVRGPVFSFDWAHEKEKWDHILMVIAFIYVL